MTTVGGNNITLTAATLAGADGTYIIRTPTADSSDTLDTANNLLLEYFGEDSVNFIGSTWEVTIYNDSNFIITLNPGAGLSLFPSNPDTILPQTTKIYIFVQTAVSTVSVYQQSNGNSVSVSGIQLTDGNVLVGSSTNIGAGVPLSGDANIINTGALTISNDAITTIKILDSNVTNAKLANDTVNVSVGTGLTGTGSFTLGAAASISVDSTVARNTGGAVTDDALVRWDGTTGSLIQNSVVTISDAGAATGFTSLETTALTINTESIAGTRAFFGYCSTTPAISGTPTTVPFDNTGVSDTGYTLDTVTNIGEVTIADAGLYQISYEIVLQALNGTGTTRAALKGDVQIDSGGGFATITGSGSGGYMRELQGGNVTNYACGKTILANITAGDVLIVRFAQTSGTTTATIVANESTLTILRLRP